VSQVRTMPNRIIDLPQEEFRRLVDDDTRGKAPASLSAQLRAPDCAPRWYRTLRAMQQSVEGQLASKNSESDAVMLEYKAKLELLGDDDVQRALIIAEMQRRKARDKTWRAGALRFKSGLEDKLLEARQLMPDDMISERIADERNRALGLVVNLKHAIQRHHDDFPKDEEPSDSDLELWRVLEAR
jgi:hypothetical protein